MTRDVHARLRRLDQRMVGLFRGLWHPVAGANEQDAEPSWRALVAALSDEEIARGLAECAARHVGKQPPVLTVFRDLCRPPDPRNSEQRARDALAYQPERLPALPSASQVIADMPRRWQAWRILRGHVPLPPGWTADDLDAELEGADLEAMDRAVMRHRQEEATRRGMPESALPGGSPGPWLRKPQEVRP